MPTGQTFGQVVSITQTEAGHFNSAALNKHILPQIEAAVRRTYRRLHADFNWPHLHTRRDVTVLRGERYLTFPFELDIDKSIEAWVLPPDSDIWTPLDYGIGVEHLNRINSDRFDYTKPSTFQYGTNGAPERWQRSPISDNQFEIWPVTLTQGHTIRFWGSTLPANLTDANEIVDLDSDLIALFAAAEFLERQGSSDAGSKLEQAMAHYRRIRANSQNPAREFRLNPTRERWTGVRVEAPRR